MASRKSSKSATKKAADKQTASKKSIAGSTKSKRTNSAPIKSSSAIRPEQIQVKQSSEYRGKYQSNDWWNWSVWIEAPAMVLAQIEYVEYKLHPTFPDPVEKRTNAADKFRLVSEGWGEFMIELDIKQKNGGKIKKTHWLTLEYPTAPTSPTSSAKEKTQKSPTVFLSAGITDLRMGNALGEALQKKGVTVLRTDDLPTGVPWDVAIGGMIKAADLFVVLLLGGLTSWAKREIEAAKSRKLRILPVVIGSDTVLPEDIEGLQKINLKDSNLPDKIAPGVAIQIKNAVKTLPQMPD